MKSFPGDDVPLTKFLQQNRPVVPSAHPDLEDRIVAVIEAATQQDLGVSGPQVIPLRRTHRLSRGTRQWIGLMSGAIAAGLVVAIAGYHILLRPQPNEVELAELETFIEHTWISSVADLPDSHLSDAPVSDSPLSSPYLEEDLLPGTENSVVNE
jgi:hypothetical protein